MPTPPESDRDRVAASLRRHYVRGRLSVEELSERLETALGAGTDRDLQGALRGLPAPWSRSELHPLADRAGRTARRAGLFVGLAALWMFLSLVLLVVFVALVASDASGEAVAAVPLVWILATLLLRRTWRVSGR